MNPRSLDNLPAEEQLSPQIKPGSQDVHEERAPGLAAARMNPGEKLVPLSAGQKELWLLAQMNDQSLRAYNESFALRFRGEFSREALHHALSSVVERHEALRTCFDSRGDFQRVVPRVEVALPVVDLTHLSGAELEKALADELVLRARTPFHLQTPPLLRATLICLGKNDFAVSLTLHHIITDGWSNGIILSELRALYSAYVKGMPADLPQAGQFSDFVADKQAAAPGDSNDSYWKNKFGGNFPGLELPLDKPRPPQPVLEGKILRQKISQALFAQISELAQANNSTLLNVLISAFLVLLHRLTGQADLAAGTLSAGQYRYQAPNARHTVGYFVTLLPLRSTPGDDLPFLSYLDSVGEQLLEGMERGGCSVNQLAQELGLSRDSSHSSLVPCVFAVVPSLGRVQFEGAEVEVIRVHQGNSRFEISVVATPQADGLYLDWEYNTALFEEPTIARWAQHYETLLEGIVATPRLSWSGLQILTQAEAQQLLVECNQPTLLESTGRCLHELFARQAAIHPGSTALITDDQRMTYAELDQQSSELAAALQTLGVGQEVVVAVALPRSIEMVTAILGVLKAGGAYLPLEISYPAERLSFMLRDSQARVLLTRKSIAPVWPGYEGKVLNMDTDWPAASGSIPAKAPVATVEPANLAYVIYTSGSTARPKGVMVSHESILNRLRWMITAYGWGAQESTLQKTPLIFDASIWELFVPLLTGGRAVLARPDGEKDPAYMAKRITQENISILQLVPSALTPFMKAARTIPLKLKQLFCGGEALPAPVACAAAKQFNVKLTNLYGPTEAAIDVTYWDYSGSEDRALVPIGRPIANTSCYILDRNFMPAPVGVTGNLYVSGPGLARGYCRRPDMTAEKFIPNPFASEPGTRMYATGDLARRLPSGEIEFAGRADTQIKLRGFRIELGEIEGALCNLPGVAAAAVNHWTGPDGADQLVAYVVPLNGQKLSPAIFRRSLQEQLPEYMVPSSFLEIPALPRTPSGKVDRKALPAPTMQRAEGGTKGQLPRTPTERLIAGFWEELLNIQNVGINESFFEVGGHSLSVLQLLSRIEETFHVQLPLRSVFDTPTIAQVAEAIAQSLQKPDSAPRPALLPMPADAPKVLSFAQQRLWFLNQLEPESTAYNLPSVIPLAAELDVEVLRRALAELIQRHQALRTVFVESNGTVVQAVQPYADVPLEISDLRDAPENERSKLARTIVDADSNLPFDLARGPLFRTRVLHMGKRKHLLLVVFHHIASDGWSFAIFRRELEYLYNTLLEGLPVDLPALPIQYTDYAHWQRLWMQGRYMDEQIAYWRERLANSPALVTLPPDRPRPPVQTYRGASQIVTLPGALTNNLRRLSRRSSVTLFMTLLSAFKVLLLRHGIGDDIVVGTHVANRDRIEMEGLIGFFVNSLVLRTNLSGDPAFEEVLRRVRDTTLSAFTYQDLPFERLVEEVQPQRNLGVTPLYQVAFDFQQDQHPVDFEAPRTFLLSDTPNSKFDINFTVEELPNRLALIVEYSVDLYEKATIERFLQRYRVVLESVVANSGQDISDIELLSQAELKHLRSLSQGRRAPYHLELTISQHFEEQARRVPDRTAAVAGEAVISYDELNREANRLARLLMQCGLAPGRNAVILAPRGIEFLTAALAVLKTGGAYVPVDPDYPASRVQYMLSNCNAAILLTCSDADTAFAEALNQATGLRSIVLLDSVDPSLPVRNDAGAIRCFGRKDFAAFPAEDVDGPNLQDSRYPAYVLYTSGSTGKPKGAMVKHDGALNHSLALMDELRLQDGFSFLQSAPSSSDISVWQMFAPLLAGGRTVFADMLTATDPQRLLALLQAQRISVAELVPSVFKHVVDYLAALSAEERALPDLQWMVVTGEEAPVALLNAWFDLYPAIPVANVYGPTEASDDFTLMMMRGQLAEERATASIGKPLPNTGCYIVDDKMRLAPGGVRGELCAAGISVGEGYLGNPQQTALHFVPDPFSSVPGQRLYRTGDQGRWLQDGTIEFFGRIDQQVKVRGCRIELSEIEAALRDCDGVHDCAVIVRRENEDQQLAAYMVPKPGAALDATRLRESLAQKLPRYMLPSAFAFQDSLPLGPSGKLDRQALAAMALSEADTPAEAIPLANQEQRVLAEIWAEVLRIDVAQLGARSDFFASGGHSLLATLVLSRINERMGVQLPLRSLFEFPTIEGLAAHIQAEAQGSRNQLPRLTRTPRKRHANA